MKVCFEKETGWYSAVRDQVVLEGDELDKSADLVIATELKKPQGETRIGGDSPVPLAAVADLEGAVDFLEGEDSDFFTIRWYNEEFSPQNIVTFPIKGMMNEGLGLGVDTGSTTKFLSGAVFDVLYSSEGLREVVREFEYRGPVIAGWAFLPGKICLTHIRLGLYPFLTIPLFEGLTTKITDFLTGKNQLLKESSLVSILVSRYPFPFQEQTSDVIHVRNLTPPVLKHFWTYEMEFHRHSFYTDRTIIGMATAWGALSAQDQGQRVMSLSEANRRALRTCRSLDVPNKQFRTDVDFRASFQWHQLEEILKA